MEREELREDGAAEDFPAARDTGEDEFREDSSGGFWNSALEESAPGETVTVEASEEADIADDAGSGRSVSRAAQAGRRNTKRNTRKRY